EISLIFHYFLLNSTNKNKNTMQDDIMLIKELAEYLKINEKTAYKYAAEGKIPAFKVGGAWRFRRDEIDKFTKGQYMPPLKSGIEDK
ncbi:TPA: helix-turn-helix domain-containing protein, partial [Legionella pneumophila]